MSKYNWWKHTTKEKVRKLTQPNSWPNRVTLNGFSGVDISATVEGRRVGTIQAISWNVHREMAPVYTVNNPPPRESFSRCAGQLIVIEDNRIPDVFDVTMRASDEHGGTKEAVLGNVELLTEDASGTVDIELHTPYTFVSNMPTNWYEVS